MKCKHFKSFENCGPCLKKVLSKCARSEACKCYVNAVILQPNSSSTVIRNLTSDEITNQDGCLTIPLTTSCNGASQLKLGACKSPVDSWCKIVDSGNGFITSLQVPKGCCGCYNFELSASVTVTGTLSILFNALNLTFPINVDLNLPIRADLKLSEQIQRETNCVTDNILTQQNSCFTSETFPIIGLPMASQTLSQFDFSFLSQILPLADSANQLSTASSQPPAFSNLSVSGLVCLKDCQRLVPTITLHPFDLNRVSNILVQIELIIGVNPGVRFGPTTLTNVRLHLANLSLKLVRVASCETECNSKFCR